MFKFKLKKESTTILGFIASIKTKLYWLEWWEHAVSCALRIKSLKNQWPHHREIKWRLGKREKSTLTCPLQNVMKMNTFV